MLFYPLITLKTKFFSSIQKNVHEENKEMSWGESEGGCVEGQAAHLLQQSRGDGSAPAEGGCLSGPEKEEQV